MAEEISPIALNAVTRIVAIFAVEREITGLSAAARHEFRQQRVAPLVNNLHDWMQPERARMAAVISSALCSLYGSHQDAALLGRGKSSLAQSKQ